MRMLSLRQNKKIVFSRTCAGKRHLKSRERGDRKGANGGKREGERSERESVVTRQDKISRRVGGHAPPQRHLKRSAATMKTRFTGRKQPNELREVRLLSSRPYQTLLLFPVMPHILYVVVFVENIEHFAELFSLLLVELNVVGRYLFLFC